MFPVCGTLVATKLEPAGASVSGISQAEIEGVVVTINADGFTIGNQRVVTTGSTRYEGGVASDIAVGTEVEAEGSISDETLRQICMHITAAVPRPQGVSANDVPAHIVEKERKFRIEQAMESGKPKEIAEKMVEGGMRKFYEEVALLEQVFVLDPSKKIKDVVGSGAKLIAYQRYQVGEQA